MQIKKACHDLFLGRLFAYWGKDEYREQAK